MDFIKSLPFTMALLIIGALFVLIGTQEGMQLGSFSIHIQTMWIKITLLMIGIVAISCATYIEVRVKGSIKKPAIGANSRETIIPEKAADDFFHTLDDKSTANFASITKGARRISILSRTAVNLLGQYQQVIEELGNSGCIIRFLLVDPHCEAARFVYGSGPSVYSNNVEKTLVHLKSIRTTIGNRLEIKTTKNAPTLSMIFIEKQSLEESFVKVQLYFLHSCVGRDRPIFMVRQSDKWYKVFSEEYKKIWESGDAWDESLFTQNSACTHR